MGSRAYRYLCAMVGCAALACASAPDPYAEEYAADAVRCRPASEGGSARGDAASAESQESFRRCMSQRGWQVPPPGAGGAEGSALSGAELGRPDSWAGGLQGVPDPEVAALGAVGFASGRGFRRQSGRAPVPGLNFRMRKRWRPTTSSCSSR